MKTIIQIWILLAVSGGMLYAQSVVHPWKVVDRGGGTAIANGVTLRSSIGQTAIAVGSAAGATLEGGYMPGLRNYSGTTSTIAYRMDSSWPQTFHAPNPPGTKPAWNPRTGAFTT